ncbi:MAG: hypothetical protein ACP5QR_05100 [Rhizomicrobium sp.]
MSYRQSRRYASTHAALAEHIRLLRVIAPMLADGLRVAFGQTDAPWWLKEAA